MKRPLIFNPVSGKVVNVFSQNVHHLLDKGYMLKQLIGVDESCLTLLTIFNNIPIITNQDIDLQIMSHMPYKTIKQWRRVNQYTYQLSLRKDFWVNRINNQQLNCPSPLHCRSPLNWMRVYLALAYANEDIDDLEKKFMTESWSINMFDQQKRKRFIKTIPNGLFMVNIDPQYADDIIHLMNISNIDIPCTRTKNMKISKLEFWYPEKTHVILVKFVKKVKINITKQQALSFLFYMYYNNVLQRYNKDGRITSLQD